MKLSTQLLVIVIVFEAVVIGSLISSRAQFKVVTTQTPITAVQNPLKQAVEYEASDKKFDELVSKYPEWISYRSKNAGTLNWPVLADCALLKRTNYARTLILHGAKVDDAREALSQTGSEEAIMLLKELELESKSN